MNIQDVISKDLQNGERAGQAGRPRRNNTEVRKRFHYEAEKEDESAEQIAASLALEQQTSSSSESSQYNLRSKRVKQIHKATASPRRTRSDRELEPPYECTRDEVFQMGTQIQQAMMLKAIQEHQCKHLGANSEPVGDVENEGEIEANEEESEIGEIAQIAEHRSEYVASQVATIYELCEGQSNFHAAAAAKIQRFAIALASRLPQKEVKPRTPVDETIELDPSFLELAKKMAKALPFEIDDIAITKLAKDLQARADSANTEAEGAEEVEPKKFDVSEQEKHICRILGNLMLIAQDNIVLASKLVSSRNIEESEVKILAESSKALLAAKERIDSHLAAHQATVLQNTDLAHFQKLTLEVAKLLMLKPGFLNVGIVDDLLNTLIPEKFKGTLIVQNMTYILNQLKNDPLLWLLLSEVEPPESPQLPSNELIRVTLGLGPKEPITKLHAQITILSAVIRPIRQAKSGTCFATSWLIKTTYTDLKSCIEDYSEAIRHGETRRQIHHEFRTFTFQTRTTKEALDTILEAEADGSITRVTRYEGTAAQRDKDPRSAFGAKLYDAPGIRQACQALDVPPVDAIIHALSVFKGTPFTIEQLLTELAKHAEAKQNAVPYRLRSASQNTLQELIDKALYAFAAQANHPLHRAWEQLTASMVSYFGSQYSFPHWTHETLTRVMQGITKPESSSYKRMQKLLLSEMFLPMIVRMRYRYNHYFPDRKKLFGNVEYGGNEKSYYGYELCDTGLPADFKFSRRLHTQIEQESSMMHLERFGEYPPSHTWKVVDSGEKFQDFILSVMNQTVEHLKESNKSVYTNEEWDQFAARFSAKVKTERFTKLMIEKILGPYPSQRKKLQKNEYTMATLPWRYKWGGDPDAVLKTYHSFKELPSNQLKFSGTQKEVLAWHLNYLKGQPENIRSQLSEPYLGLTQAGSPCHSFLFRPFEPSVKKACESELPTNEYISVNVEAPGLEVGSSIVSKEARAEIIDYIAKNMWVSKESEKHDLDRQELTEEAKLIFDVKIKERDISTMTVAEFKDFVFATLIRSRAADIKVGKRYRHWELHFKTVLKNKINQLLPNVSDDAKIPPAAAVSIINFARNRKDTLHLTEGSTRKLLLQARRIPQNLSIPEFRNALLDIAASIREEEMGCKDKHWLGGVKTAIDNKIYKTLPQELKNKLVNSAIVVHDTNWMEGIHDLHFAFLVNPATSKIEMVEYNPDKMEIRFFGQSSWFPKKKNAGWQLPDNYRAFAGAPIFNAGQYLHIH